MFLIRRSRVEDIGTLLKLAKMVHFINLPADKDIITAKVLHSRSCFIRLAGGADHGPGAQALNGSASTVGYATTIQSSDLFMFTLEDTESGGVLGTSQVIARVGGPGNPHVSFRLFRREFFSQSLQQGNTHTVARLHLDESGLSEIGGLIVQPSYRRHKARLGRFLSLVRFHFVGLHRALFADTMIAEMMAPITPEGLNLLWENLGRRFINLSYTEADRFCQYSREFMFTLFPREDIYLSLLPPEARAVVAQVHPETAPARRLLESLGFRHHDLIDPFDGGPYLTSTTDDISIVRETRRALLGAPVAESRCRDRAFVSVLDADGEFRAIESPCSVDGQGRVHLPGDYHRLLGAEAGSQVGFTPQGRARPAGKSPRPGAKSDRSRQKAS